jgi:hypothetical protein
VPDSPVPANNNQRLALIQRLWLELKAARKDPTKYNALMDRIRRETDAFRQTLDKNDPTKF